MEVIILAGGFGTRLSHVISDVPKPMAPIDGEPFLKYIFEYLRKSGVTHTILAVGYKHENIKNYFRNKYKEIHIKYSIEDTPLGTGGAIKKAMNECCNEDVFIINGDTFFDVDLKEMELFHQKHESKLTIAVKELKNCDRYGSVIIEDNRVKRFAEKTAVKNGKINGGIYLVNRGIFDSLNEKAFSFETMLQEENSIDIFGYESSGYFIDIGVPDDYYKAQDDLKEMYKHDGKSL